MPSLQTVDLNQETEPGVNPAETNMVNFFSKLGKDYKDKEDRVEIGKILEQYSTNKDKAQGISQARTEIAKGTLSPTKQLQANELINAEEKAVIERDKMLNLQVKTLADQARKDTIAKEKKAADKAKKDAITAENKVILKSAGKTDAEIDDLAPKISTATARTMIPTNTKSNKDIFESGLAKEASKEVPKLEQTIAKNKDVLTNIETISEIVNKDLTGPKGYVKAAFNTESAAQLTTLGASNLDTVIKLFNPVGTLPTQKLNWIRNTFTVSPWDNTSTIQGKLKTQKILAQQSQARAEERVRLLKEYGGIIPADIDKQFNKDTDDLLTIMEEQYGDDGKPKKSPKNESGKLTELPPAADYPNKFIKDDKTGQRYQSKNGEWVPV